MSILEVFLLGLYKWAIGRVGILRGYEILY